MRWQAGGTSIRLQVAGLVFASTAAALLASVLIVAWVKPPPRFKMTIADALATMAEQPDAPAALDRTVASEAPFEQTDTDPNSPAGLIAQAVSETLHKAPNEVRVGMLEDRGFGPERIGSNDAAEARQPGAVVLQGLPPPDKSVTGGTKLPSLSDMLLQPSVRFDAFEIAIRQSDTSWVTVAPDRSVLSPWQWQVTESFGLSALVLVPAGWFVARRLTRPIQSFASAVERFGRDPFAPPIAEIGPTEVRVAVRAFNRMQEQLRGYIEERTRMVAAMAHDLRAPLTSMRVRVDSAPHENRDRLIADIERLATMSNEVLAFVRGEQVREIREWLDLGDMAEACVEEIRETGADVTCQADEQTDIMGEPINLRRCITNLIDNGVKYGGKVAVSVVREAGTVIFRVDDTGPGLPPDKLEEAFEPFRQIGHAGTGFGLGLALARTIVRAHDGTITLSNRPEGGLRAEIRLAAEDRRQSAVA